MIIIVVPHCSTKFHIVVRAPIYWVIFMVWEGKETSMNYFQKEKAKNTSKSKKTTTTSSSSRALVISSAVAVLLILSFAATALSTSTTGGVAYAQSSGDISLTLTCAADENGQLHLLYSADNLIPNSWYAYQTLDSGGTLVNLEGRFETTSSANRETFPDGGALPGEQYTLNVYEDPDANTDTLSPEELVASDTVICPSQDDEQTPVERIGDLRETINNMDIPDRLKRSLLGPLTNIERILTDDDPSNDADTCSRLDDFITSVNDKSRTQGGLTQQQAEELINQAEAIKEAIGC